MGGDELTWAQCWLLQGDLIAVQLTLALKEAQPEFLSLTIPGPQPVAPQGPEPQTCGGHLGDVLGVKLSPWQTVPHLHIITFSGDTGVYLTQHLWDMDCMLSATSSWQPR